MSLRFVASAACAFAVATAVAFSAHASEPVSLDDAFGRVIEKHPDLRLFGSRRDALAADLKRAALGPALVVGAEIENSFGTGATSGVDSAEFTLTLASVLERGGRLDARRTLVQSRLDALAVERESRRLDLLAEVARRYLAVVAAERQLDIANLDMKQRRGTIEGARRRLQAGASPESVVLTAEAALARAELDSARAAQRSVSARRHLAALWGERDPTFDIVDADPLRLPAIEDFGSLAALLERTPELVEFVGERRIREARLRLAQTEETANIDWQVGVRRLQSTDEFALVGGVSMPLDARRRAAPEILAAEAEIASLEIEREAKGMSLYSTLAEAHGRYRVAEVEVERLASDVLPKLAQAEAATERAYRAGAISYLEWAQLQSEQTLARKQQLEAALDAQRALIEIQRLTGTPFVTSAESSTKKETDQ